MFEKFVETLNQTGKTVGEKTKQGTDVVKANLKISSEERAVNELFLEIGRTYYENKKDDPCCETMKELFDKVAEKQEAIEALKEQVRRIKGVNICRNCGAEVDSDNDFCGRCGTKIVKPEPVIEETAEEKPGEVIDREETAEVTDEEGKPAINIEVADDESGKE